MNKDRLACYTNEKTLKIYSFVFYMLIHSISLKFTFHFKIIEMKSNSCISRREPVKIVIKNLLRILSRDESKYINAIRNCFGE